MFYQHNCPEVNSGGNPGMAPEAWLARRLNTWSFLLRTGFAQRVRGQMGFPALAYTGCIGMHVYIYMLYIYMLYIYVYYR
jgi:hypothetical protein